MTSKDDATETYLPDVFTSAATETIGKKVLEEDAELGRVKFEFYAGDNFLNRTERVFGGFLAAMLDSCCGHPAAITNKGGLTLTLELKTSFIGRAKKGKIIGKGWLTHRTSTIAFTEGELYNDEGELVAKASATLMLKPPRE